MTIVSCERLQFVQTMNVLLLGTSGHVTLSVDMIGKHSISCFNEEILCIKNWNHFKNCMYHKLNNLRL